MALLHFLCVVFHVAQHVGNRVAVHFLDEVVGAIAIDAHAHHVRVAEQVVQVAQRFLVSADQKHAKIIFLAIAHRVQRQHLGHFFRTDEAVDLAIAIACDVGDDSLAHRLLIEAVDRGDWEQLVDGPSVRQRLEQAEIAVIDVGKRQLEAFEVSRQTCHVVADVGNLVQQVKEQVLRGRTRAQVELAALEELTRFVAVEVRVVVALLDARFRQVRVDLAHARNKVVLVVALLGQLGRFEVRRVEHVEDQDR